MSFLKAREITEEQQQLQLDKLIASQTRARIALEKTHTKTLKKIAKCGENTEQKQQAFKGELQAMLQTQDQQVWGQGHEQRGHTKEGQGQNVGNAVRAVLTFAEKILFNFMNHGNDLEPCGWEMSVSSYMYI